MVRAHKFFGLMFGMATLVGNLAWSQLSLRWIYTSDYAQRHDYGRAVQIDRAGSVYTAGFSRSAAGDYDIFVLKLSPVGVPIWYVRYAAPAGGDDKADHLVLDEDRGRLYVAGVSSGVAPDDYIVLAYSMETGELLWERRYSNVGENSMQAGGIAAITLDATGNLYVSGALWNGYDYDAVTLKYDPDGNLQWEYADPSYWGSYFYAGLALATREDNLYVLQGDWNGWSTYGIDLVCLDIANGVERWRANFQSGRIAIPADMSLDHEGNIGVLYTLRTGNNSDIGVTRFSPAGNILWTRLYHHGLRDHAVRLLVDEANSFYAVGTVMVSGQFENCVVAAFDFNGAQRWTTMFDRARLPDLLTDAVYSSGRLYLTSWSQGSPANFDLTIIELDTAGVVRSWTAYNGAGNHWDGAYAITASPCGKVYVAGGTDVSGSGSNADLLVAHYQSGSPGDIDRNGCVDDADLLAVLFAFGATSANLPEDANCDGVVDDADLLIVLFNFGQGC